MKRRLEETEKSFHFAPPCCYAGRALNGMKFLLTGLVTIGLASSAMAQSNLPPLNILPPPGLAPATVLAWDADLKEYNAKTNEATASFTFWVTNTSPTNVSITSVSTSCGCTVAQLPSQPWVLRPGERGPIKVSLDVRGRHGAVMKGVTVNSTAGVKALVVRANVPQPTTPDPGFAVPTGSTPLHPAAVAPMSNERVRNLQVALGNRQAVFKGECARCHAEPGRGKTGQDLYAAVCGICHDAKQRAAMVPDLRQPKKPRALEDWKKSIVEGRAGSLMPAFAAAEGGPLSEEQIAGLADYLDKNFPKEPTKATLTPLAPDRRKW